MSAGRARRRRLQQRSAIGGAIPECTWRAGRRRSPSIAAGAKRTCFRHAPRPHVCRRTAENGKVRARLGMTVCWAQGVVAHEPEELASGRLSVMPPRKTRCRARWPGGRLRHLLLPPTIGDDGANSLDVYADSAVHVQRGQYLICSAWAVLGSRRSPISSKSLILDSYAVHVRMCMWLPNSVPPAVPPGAALLGGTALFPETDRR
jgi:hypothetical protein